VIDPVAANESAPAGGATPRRIRGDIVLNLAINLMLAPIFGATGSALGTAIATVLGVALTVWPTWRYLALRV
jgi:hypothetical protein